MAEPMKLPCNHRTCLTCIITYLDNANRCPICRAQIPGNFIPTRDVDFQALVRQHNPKEFDKLILELDKYWKNELKFAKIKLQVGNLHEAVQGADEDTQNKHRWTFFVRCQQIPVESLIQEVTVKLHPTFNPPEVKLTKAPFQFSRIGWGVFELGISIIIKPELGVGAPVKVTHFLSFSAPETSNTVTVKVLREKLPQVAN